MMSQEYTGIKGRKLEILCYLEGIRIPVKAVYLSSQVGVPTVGTISAMPFSYDGELLPTTHVAIFYSYSDGSSQHIRDRYKLMFHGEVTGARYNKNGIQSEYQISIIDSRSYLNRLPERMLGILYGSNSSKFFPEYAEDSVFYGIRSGDVIENYLQFNEFQDYSLEEYFGRLLGLLRYSGNGCFYYRNANIRYRIASSHSIKEYGDSFRRLWGSMSKSSMIQNINYRLQESGGLTVDGISQALSQTGYLYTSVTCPKSKANNSLYEYILTRDMINHRAPKFNYILVDRDDGLGAVTAMPEVTAIKYKYTLPDNQTVIDNTVYPPESMSNGIIGTGSLTLTSDERLYGIRRSIEEMNWLFNAFLSDAHDHDQRVYRVRDSGNANNRGSHLHKKQKYDFILKQCGKNSVSINKGTFVPEYVLGMPCFVHDPMTGTGYRGNIWRLSYGISIDKGSSSTGIEVVNSQRVTRRRSGDQSDWVAMDGLGNHGCNPYGEREFLNGEGAFYRELFYNESTEEPLLSSSHIGSEQNREHDSYYKFIEREHCTLRQYLKSYGIPLESQQDSIPEDILSTYSAEASVNASDDTIANLSGNLTSITASDSAGGLFIRERRMIVKEMARQINRRVLHV